MCENPASPCVWSTGKEFLPKDKGVCVQPVLTAAYPDFAGCGKMDTSSTCATPCKWFDAGYSTCPTAPAAPTCTGGTWNKEKCSYDCPAFNEAPSFVPMTCTHKTAQSSDVSQVGLCKGLKDMNTCAQDGCQWNHCKRDTTRDASPPSSMQCPMGAPYFDDYVCGFSCPPTGYCKSNALPTAADALPTTAAAAYPTLNADGTYTPAAVDTCTTFRNKESCPSTGCSWTEFPRPLF